MTDCGSSQEPSKKAIVSVLETRGAKVVFVPDVSYTVEGLTESLQGNDAHSHPFVISIRAGLQNCAHKRLP